MFFSVNVVLSAGGDAFDMRLGLVYTVGSFFGAVELLSPLRPFYLDQEKKGETDGPVMAGKSTEQYPIGRRVFGNFTGNWSVPG